MKTYAHLTTAAFLVGSLLSVQAEPKEDVLGAIKKLSEKGNYTWTSTTKRPETGGDDGNRNNRFRGGPMTGKLADGFVHVTTSFGERTFESIRKGDRAAVKREEGWSVLEPRQEGGNDEDQDGRRGRGRTGFSRMSPDPADRATELLESLGELKKDGDLYAGDLTEEGAQSLVSPWRGRRGGDQDAERPQPEGVKGSAKFWVKDGMLIKYEYSMSGSITYNDTKRDLSRTTTVEIKDVGATKIDVPEPIKKELAADEASKEASE